MVLYSGYWSDWSHEVILNENPALALYIYNVMRPSISAIMTQRVWNKTKLTNKERRYWWPASIGRTGQRNFLHLFCSLQGAFFSLVQTVAALLTKLLGLFAHSLKFDRFQTLRNNSQQQATRYNREYKQTQHVTSNNVGTCWPTILRPFARSMLNKFRYS